MKIVSWNVNGVRAIMKKGFTESFRKLDADIFCLQETKAQDDQVFEALEWLDDYHVFCCSAKKKGYSGTAILTHLEPLDVTCNLGISDHDNEGRVLTAEFADFYIVTVYTPNSQNELRRLDYRQEWDKCFLEHLNQLNRKKPVIACGDFNVAHQPIDLARPKPNYNKTPGYTQQEIDGFSAIMDSGYVDTWRYQHPEEQKYSWWSYRGGAREKNVGWRIDYVIASSALENRINHTEIHNDVFGSDHCPVSLTLK
jgi:exodeoxyribonuclease-3